jgi:hypothetical protein
MKNAIPLTVQVDDPLGKWFTCMLNVPTGVYTMGQSFGKSTGIMNPGLSCCFCYCCHARSISCMITKNTIRYACPINNVPTKDNVMVSLDVGVNFHIGR